jgi:hypothetical protein
VATDTTELTFIRCPECRSLVPAMSSRCRMCGATLAKDNKSASSDNSNQEQIPQPTRSRQPTVSSSSSSDLTNQLNALRQENDSSVLTHNSAQNEVENNNDDLVDPLEDFLSEDENDFDNDENQTPSDGSSDDDSNDDDFNLADSDEDEDLDEEFDDLDDLDDLEEDFDSDLEEEFDEQPVSPEGNSKEVTKIAEPVIDTAALAAAKQKVEEEFKPKTRVVVEQGRGKFSKGLSFGAPKNKEIENKPKEQQVVLAPEKDLPKPVEQVQTSFVSESVTVENNKIEEIKTVNKDIEEVIMQPKLKPEQEYTEPTTKSTPTSFSVAATNNQSKDTHKKGDQLGRICGWLVSFADSNGKSIEIREGRFFVTSTALRGTDLVLEDTSVSTPHAMFTVSADGGIVIQDLKSDRGVFVREQNKTTYHREYDSVVLNHGDWVRFGDLEFLVSVIAHVGSV